MIGYVKILKKTVRTPKGPIKAGSFVKVLSVSGKGYAVEAISSKLKVYDAGFDILA